MSARSDYTELICRRSETVDPADPADPIMKGNEVGSDSETAKCVSKSSKYFLISP